jgi:hypothetical protein
VSSAWSWAFGSAPTSRRYSTKSRLVTLPQACPVQRPWHRYSVDVGAVQQAVFARMSWFTWVE